MSDIGSRIKRRRIELGYSQDELARKLGYNSRSTINKIENGTNDITQSKLFDFSVALDTSVPYLMGWDEGSYLSSSEMDIISIYRGLNADGKSRFREYAQMLTVNDAFKKDTLSSKREAM